MTYGKGVAIFIGIVLAFVSGWAFGVYQWTPTTTIAEPEFTIGYTERYVPGYGICTIAIMRTHEDFKEFEIVGCANSEGIEESNMTPRL